MVSWTDTDMNLYELRQRKQSNLIDPSPAERKFIKASPAAEAEEELHNEIIDYCRTHGWVYYHGSMAHRTRRTVGEPDFSIRADRGRVFDIEVKRPGETLSPHQLANLIQCERLGHTVHVVRSMDEFLAVVQH